MFHAYILLVGACLPLVSASVYPTQPVQATVWSADQPMLVNWIEDYKYPALKEMGPVEISLWCTDTYIASLASGVDPMAKTRQVMVPGRALKHGPKYTLRFTTSKPVDTVVYSADFTIVPANTTAGTSTGTGNGAAALATQSGASAGSGPGAGTGSSSTWARITTITSASGTGTMKPSGVPSPLATIPGGGSGKTGQRAASAGRRGVDVEKLKFRFVFVIWPILMGITMAL